LARRTGGSVALHHGELLVRDEEPILFGGACYGRQVSTHSDGEADYATVRNGGR
jgi:hypothetical protein